MGLPYGRLSDRNKRFYIALFAFKSIRQCIILMQVTEVLIKHPLNERIKQSFRAQG